MKKRKTTTTELPVAEPVAEKDSDVDPKLLAALREYESPPCPPKKDQKKHKTSEILEIPTIKAGVCPMCRKAKSTLNIMVRIIRKPFLVCWECAGPDVDQKQYRRNLKTFHHRHKYKSHIKEI